MTTLRQVAVVSFLICLTAGIVRADDFPKIFHVPEDKIEFQLYRLGCAYCCLPATSA
jgi:hypothetical protein